MKNEKGAKNKESMLSFDWSFTLVTIVMSLALTRVGGRLFAADTSVPRKVAFVASGYQDQDDESLRNSLVAESEKLVQQLKEYGYETSWINRDSRKGTKGVAFRVFDALNALSLKKDDRLILVVNGHGSKKVAGRAAHFVGFGDGSRLDLSEISKKLESFTQAGAKIAVIDESCYSGNTIDLASTGACVITSQNRFNFSRTGSLVIDSVPLYSDHDFSQELRKAMEDSKGQSLEDVFLKARRNLDSVFPHTSDSPSSMTELIEKLHYGNDLPEISSWEHLAFRDYWDEVFFSNDPEFWKSDLSPLKTAAENRLWKPLVEFFTEQAKKAFEFSVLSFDRFTELQRKRTTWVNEVARLESLEAATTQSSSLRKQTLIEKLRSTSEEYLRSLGRIYKVERDLYEQFYHSFRQSHLPTNACREFKL